MLIVRTRQIQCVETPNVRALVVIDKVLVLTQSPVPALPQFALAAVAGPTCPYR